MSTNNHAIHKKLRLYPGYAVDHVLTVLKAVVSWIQVSVERTSWFYMVSDLTSMVDI